MPYQLILAALTIYSLIVINPASPPPNPRQLCFRQVYCQNYIKYTCIVNLIIKKKIHALKMLVSGGSQRPHLLLAASDVVGN